VLDLPLASPDQRRVIGGYLTIMRGWRWNLVPLFVLGFVLLGLVVLEVLRTRRRDLQRVSMVEVLAGPFKPASV
jgi:MFS family permease